MSTPFAQAISYIFHPVFVPLIAMYIFFNSGSYHTNNPNSDELFRFMYQFAGLLTVLMPIISLAILVRNNFVSSFSLPKQEERTGPFLITAFYYALFYFLLKKLPPSVISWEFFSMQFGAILVLLVVTLINLKMKISIHAAGYAGLVGIYMALVGNDVILLNHSLMTSLIILVGIIGTARLSLGAHKPSEIYMGALVGFLCTFLVVKYQIYI
jgi:membrane-associated phospholipid phosphatase